MQTYTHGHIATPVPDAAGNRVPLNLQELTGSGNFVAPVDGVFRVAVVAKGGNGATGATSNAGGGGGSGGETIGIFTLTSGQVVPYDVTDAQAWFSDVAELFANSGGNGGLSTPPTSGGQGAAIGGGSKSQIALPGRDGAPGQSGLFSFITILPAGGNGGDTRYGGGGRGGAPGLGQNSGDQGSGYGSGGGGGNSLAVLGGAGGAGAEGAVIIEW